MSSCCGRSLAKPPEPVKLLAIGLSQSEQRPVEVDGAVGLSRERPLYPKPSQETACALHDDIHDTSFDAAPLLNRYPLQLTRLEDWIEGHGK
jgi:hypothetical protein